ncbi:MAG: DUF1189 family protein [Candidatus Omnitrophota bacterium]
MNKIKDILLSFFLAPITGFFLPKVYRDASRASWRKGVLYTAYGALIITGLVMAIFLERASTSDKFIRWVKENVPVVIWTPKGLSLENGQKIATLTHPTYGPIVTFDMDRESITKKDMGQLFLIVTSKRIVFRKMLGQLEDRDVTKLTPRTQQQPLPSKVRVTGELIENLYLRFKFTFLAATPITLFPIALIVLLFINGVFTLVGLLLNETRRQKLNFSGILNLACFSTGTSLTVTGLIMIGLLFSHPLPGLLTLISLLASLLYMIAAVIFVAKPTSPHPS